MTEIIVLIIEVRQSLLVVYKYPINYNLLNNLTIAENTLVNLGFNIF
jgi:hypothetical protein